MKCPICGIEFEDCKHSIDELIHEFELESNRHIQQTCKDKKEIERLKSIIGRSSDQINLIKKNIDVSWFEEQRLASIKVILKEVEQ